MNPYRKYRKAQSDWDCPSCEQGYHDRCSSSNCDCAHNGHGRTAQYRTITPEAADILFDKRKSGEWAPAIKEKSTGKITVAPVDHDKYNTAWHDGAWRKATGYSYNHLPYELLHKFEEGYMVRGMGWMPRADLEDSISYYIDNQRGAAVNIVDEPELKSPQDHQDISIKHPDGEQQDSHNLTLEDAYGVPRRIEGRGGPHAQQKCKKCDNQATKSILWCEKRAYVAVCDQHFDDMIEHITHENGGPPDEIVEIQQSKTATSMEKRLQGLISRKPDVLERHPQWAKFISELVGQAVGEASMCWDPPPSDQVFDSNRASEIVMDLTDAITKSAGHSGTFIGLNIPTEVTKKLVVDGGESADDMHITLFYSKGLTADQINAVKEAMETLWDKDDPIPARVGGVGRFAASESSDGKDVIYASIDSAHLQKFRDFFINMLREGDPSVESTSEHGWTPHITIKYIEPGEKYDLRIEPIEFEISEYKFNAGTPKSAELTRERTFSPVDYDLGHAGYGENASEDPDLKMGSKNEQTADVEAPYSDGQGPMSTNFDDNEHNILVHAMIGEGVDPYTHGRLYGYDELIPQHRREVDINWGKKKYAGRNFMWLRTTMPVEVLVDESNKWYQQNRLEKWGAKDLDKVLLLADKINTGAIMTPLMVSPRNEKNGGVWEGYHRLRAYNMLSYDKAPVLMKIDVDSIGWKERIAADSEDRQPWFCVDLDGTILKEVKHPDDGSRLSLGEPIDGAAEALDSLHSMGRVSIWTARQYFEDDDSDSATWVLELKKHLKDRGIKFDDVYIGKKPPADVFIDNSNVEFDGDWSKVEDRVKEVMKAKEDAKKELTIDLDAALGPGNGDNAVDQYTDADESREDRAITRPPELEGLTTG